KGSTRLEAEVDHRLDGMELYLGAEPVAIASIKQKFVSKVYVSILSTEGDLVSQRVFKASANGPAAVASRQVSVVDFNFAIRETAVGVYKSTVPSVPCTSADGTEILQLAVSFKDTVAGPNMNSVVGSRDICNSAKNEVVLELPVVANLNTANEAA